VGGLKTEYSRNGSSGPIVRFSRTLEVKEPPCIEDSVSFISQCFARR
jgi:hypothetical protein